MEEKWLPLYDFEGYFVSNTGKIKSIDRTVIHKNGNTYNIKGRELKQRTNGIEPHLFCDLSYTLDGVKIRKTVYVHRAVAEHFILRPSKNHIYVTHLTTNYLDNSVTNLAWITHKQLLARQPKRIADPGKSWRTRREKYGNSWGSSEKPKWNTRKQWETKKSKYKYKKDKL